MDNSTGVNPTYVQNNCRELGATSPSSSLKAVSFFLEQTCADPAEEEQVEYEDLDDMELLSV